MERTKRFLIPALALLVGLGIGLGAGRPSPVKHQAAAPVAPTADASDLLVNVPPIEKAPDDTYTPVAKDFKLAIKVKSKECFGSAGCVLTYRVDVQYLGQALDPSQTWEVTYQVTGGESGPIVNTFTVTGDEASVDQIENLSTKSVNYRLRVSITDISRSEERRVGKECRL